MKKTTLTLVLFLVCTHLVFSQWQKLNLTKTAGGTIPVKVNYMVINSNKLYAATTDGIWVSASRSGGDWEAYGLQGKEVTHLNFGVLKLAVTAEIATDDATKKTGKLYKSDGTNWLVTNYNPTGVKNFSVTIDFAQIQNGSSTVIIMPNWGNGVWSSADNGDTWTSYPYETSAIGTHYKAMVGAFVVPGDNIIYATDKVTASNHFLDYSTDYGVTWNKMEVGNFFNPYAFHKRNYQGKSYMYYGGQNGNNGALWRSENNGTSWDASLTMGVPYWENRRIIGVDDGPLYIMCSKDGVYVSTDNGDSFIAVGTGLVIPSGAPTTYMTHMALSSEKLYVSNIDNGIFYFNLTPSAVDKVVQHESICYPSIAKNELTVNSTINSKISVLTLDGKVIKTVTAQSEKLNLDIRNLVPSMYILKSQRVDGKIYIDKFIKE